MAQAGLRSDIGQFGIVPGWLLDAGVSPTALKVYAVLACKFADRDGVAFPSRRVLAQAAGLAVRSVDRAVDELTSLGALTVTPHYDPSGSRSSNRYRLRYAAPSANDAGGGANSYEGVVQNLHEGSAESAPRTIPIDPDPLNQRHLRSTHPLTRLRTPEVRRTGHRPRDELWEALESIMGRPPGTKSERGAWNAALKELREAGATPEELVRRAARYRAAWPGVDLTPTALARHWGRFAQDGDVAAARRMPSGRVSRCRSSAPRKLPVMRRGGQARGTPLLGMRRGWHRGPSPVAG